MMQAEIVSIGDELLKGLRVNTNAAEMSAMLSLEGVPVRRITACSDLEDEMQEVLAEALGRSELVLVTGGLGPTRDDRTRNALQQLLGRGLRLDGASLREVELRVASRGREMTELMQSQAMVLEGSEAMPNTKGTAAGMIINCGPRFTGRHLVLYARCSCRDAGDDGTLRSALGQGPVGRHNYPYPCPRQLVSA